MQVIDNSSRPMEKPKATTKNNTSHKNIPPSIQKEMDLCGKTNPADMNIYSLQHTAENTHDPDKGLYSGLDADEIKLLGELDPELKDQYQKLAKSDVNKKNLQNDIDEATSDLKNAQNRYDELNKTSNNRLLNLFRSKESKNKMQSELKRAKIRLDYAQYEYDYATNKSVISYETLLQRNGGKEIK